MATSPWGPHGPQVPANTVTPNPTAASPSPGFDQTSYAAAPMPVGDSGEAGGFLANAASVGSR